MKLLQWKSQGIGAILLAGILFTGALPVNAQEIRSFDPRGLVVGVGFGTGTYGGDGVSPFNNANAAMRFESFYNLSERLSAGLNFISAKYGLRGDTRGSLGLAVRFRFLEDRVSPYGTVGFHILNGGEKTGSGPMGALGIDWAASDRFSLFLEGMMQASTPDDAFDKVESGSGIDALLTVGVGLRLRLTQPKRPGFAVDITVPDTVLVGDIITLGATVTGNPASPVTLSWRVEQLTEYRGEQVRHAFRYLGPQRVTVIGRDKRYEVRQSAEIVVVDDSRYEFVGDAVGPVVNRQGRPRILEIYGDRTVKIGVSHNYRVRLRPGASWPVNYAWEMGDGTSLIGNNVLHRYVQPGQYTITAISKNSLGADTLTTQVFVEPAAGPGREPTTPSRDPTASTDPENAPRPIVRRYHPDELRSSDGVRPTGGGYGWLVGNYMDQSPAQQMLRQFRTRGFRTGILVDSQGGGSSVYRVVVGQFASTGNALAAKREVQRLAPTPISLIDISNPSSPVAPIRVSARRQSPASPGADRTPPVLSRPIVQHAGPERPTTINVSRLSAADSESGVAKIEYRITSEDGNEVVTDWTTIAEPDAPSAETNTVAELPMFARDRRVIFEARAVNGAGLSATASVPVGVNVDETPPSFDATSIRVAEESGGPVVVMALESIRDDESGVAQVRYRVIDHNAPATVYLDWTDVTGRDRVVRAVSELKARSRLVVVEVEAQNGAGAVSSYAKSLTLPVTEAVSAVDVAEAPRTVDVAEAPPTGDVADAPPTGDVAEEPPIPAQTVSANVPDVPAPQLRSVKVYVREDRLLVFLDGLLDRESTIGRVEYRVLTPDEQPITDWADVTLVPPGRSSYGLQMHRFQVPAGVADGHRLQVRVTNSAGAQTVVSSRIGNNS